MLILRINQIHDFKLTRLQLFAGMFKMCLCLPPQSPSVPTHAFHVLALELQTLGRRVSPDGYAQQSLFCFYWICKCFCFLAFNNIMFTKDNLGFCFCLVWFGLFITGNAMQTLKHTRQALPLSYIPGLILFQWCRVLCLFLISQTFLCSFSERFGSCETEHQNGHLVFSFGLTLTCTTRIEGNKNLHLLKDQQDGLAAKGACHQAWSPEFDC